ncbi:hypothetical protein [Streptomyces sp. SP18CS02]|uniref:hypothetical protein n=1 Tax=Streptomyces sp. SP18CS02 TaxID=3002531 RepID=UPI002E77D306|nr:hypothetical protein [Streptomyces sp. SP18CS02]MEE1752263.1 hypothetical protein [Streptomyces sp. SP18CS02]
MSFDEEWASARTTATANVSMRLNQAPGGPAGGSASDYKVKSPELRAIGNEAQELFHWFERDAFHAGAQTGSASDSLTADGFQTGSALWTAWDTWRGQCETLLSACAHIHNHLEATIRSDSNLEEVLISNFSMADIDKNFK